MLLGKNSKDISARVAALGANLSLTRKVTLRVISRFSDLEGLSQW